jgi:hypothetical protein
LVTTASSSSSESPVPTLQKEINLQKQKKRTNINRTNYGIEYCWNPEIQTYEIICLLTENGAKALTMANGKNER